MRAPAPSLRRRVLKALGVLIVNLILWAGIPYYVGALIAKQVPSTPLTNPAFVYEFGAVITALQVMIALTEGMAISVPLISASYLFVAFYVWEATNGGNLSLTANGESYALGFQLLVYFLILPSIWGAVRAPLDFMLRRRAYQDYVPTSP